MRAPSTRRQRSPELYDPDLMPAGLRRAHQAVDRAVDRLYSRSRFASERERAEASVCALREDASTPARIEHGEGSATPFSETALSLAHRRSARFS